MGSGMPRPDHGGSTVESRLSALAAKEETLTECHWHDECSSSAGSAAALLRYFAISVYIYIYVGDSDTGNAGVIAPSCPCCSRTAPLCAFQVATVTTTALFSEPEIAGASALALRTPKQTGRCTAAQAWRAPWMPQRLLLRRRMRCCCCPQAVLQEQIVQDRFKLHGGARA